MFMQNNSSRKQVLSRVKVISQINLFYPCFKNCCNYQAYSSQLIVSVKLCTLSGLPCYTGGGHLRALALLEKKLKKNYYETPYFRLNSKITLWVKSRKWWLF